MTKNKHSMDRDTQQVRKTRFVCISDTHCQTPRLPKGDVLIHAGDLTNQGSYSEMQKTVAWLEKADFEAKIVVAGNHDITLDSAFYAQHGSSWRWPHPQDPDEIRRLLTESKTITYLENEAVSMYLHRPNGPHTCFTVYGSPCTPKKWNWAFQYEAEEASQLWDTIPPDADIVITHTPPKGHCDTATKDDRSGCEALVEALRRIRPMLSVFGHIHEARGVQRVRWKTDSLETGQLTEAVEAWKDPGEGNNKQSLVNLTANGGRPLGNRSRLTRQMHIPEDFLDMGGDRGSGGIPQGLSSEAGNEVDRRETVMINAAFLGARMAGKAKKFNKPIVVDVDLPVWRESEAQSDGDGGPRTLCIQSTPPT